MTIVLKNRLNADVTFSKIGVSGTSVVFEAPGTTLMDRKRLVLSLTEGKNVNRVKFKLTVPTVGTDSNGVPTVSYTQVASGDVSVVRFSSVADRADLAAMLGSLAASDAVGDMINDGSMPVA